jgi:Tfp pilus assembly protein PilN
MYGRFVGLDIGKSVVCVCLINRGLREVQLLQTLSVPITQEQLQNPEYLAELFKENSLPRGDVAVSINENPTSIRIIQFPFSDSKKIDQVYEYELENISTFDPTEKIHSYHLVKNESGSEAIACIFEKDQVETLLDSLNPAGIDPKVITYSPLAFGALNDELEGNRPLLLIDIGENELGFSLFDSEGLLRVRSSTQPIDLFFQNIRDKEGISELDYSGSLFGEGGEANRKECTAPIVNEIKKTIQFFELEVKDRISTILISGPLSLIPGTQEHLSSELNREIKKLYIPELGVDKSPLFGKSYALSLYGSALKSGYLNFRKDEFKYVGMDRELRKVFMAPAVLAVILILVLIYGSVSNYFDLKSEVEEREARIAEVVRSTFPDVRAIPKPVQFMESEVEKVREKLNLIQGVEGGPTPLDVLRDISASLPPSLKLTVIEIRYEGANRVKIHGVCDSYQEVTEIEEALSKSEMFESINRDQTGSAVDGKTKFEISVYLKSNA